MGHADGTPRAVVFSALLHLGIVAFLALATLNCARWEAMADFLHLPQAMRPVTCTHVERLQGPVIEATLVGPAVAPAPVPKKHAPKAAPLPIKIPKPQIKPPPPSVQAQALPKPVPHPKLKNQQKVVQRAKQKAEEAKRAQEKERQQHMAELEQKRKQAQRLLKQLAKVQAQSEAQQRQVNLAKQKAQQLADLRKAEKKHRNAAILPPASKAKSGQEGSSTDAYGAALQNAVTKNWLRPNNIPKGAVCPVEIVQAPGGQVISAKVLPSCPFNGVAKHSVEAAVLRSSPLPYKGFEKQFRRDIIFNFTVTSSR